MALMPYETQLVQLNASFGGLSRSNTAWGFPVNTNFHTLLMSYWMCGPWYSGPGTPGSSAIWPAFLSAQFFGFGPGVNSVVSGNPFICFTNQATWGAHPYTGFFNGNIPPPQPTTPPGCLLHFMMSVDTHAQIVQVYINDVPVTVTGAWTGSQPLDFNIVSPSNTWAWDVSGVISAGIFPALADVWISNTPSFVDLSATANRRKFINADLTPVDLGSTGTAPFGYQPAMYMSVRPGGVPADFLTNLGVNGGTWLYDGSAPTFQAPGLCSLPAPPAPPKLAIDNVICRVSGPAPCELYLDWSDDRGHTFGNPVGQDMNSRGYLTSLQWQRLGMTRDRVFRLTWTCADHTALQGAWITAEAADNRDTTPGQGAG
jgi:hypothetical protein